MSRVGFPDKVACANGQSIHKLLCAMRTNPMRSNWMEQVFLNLSLCREGAGKLQIGEENCKMGRCFQRREGYRRFLCHRLDEWVIAKRSRKLPTK